MFSTTTERQWKYYNKNIILCYEIQVWFKINDSGSYKFIMVANLNNLYTYNTVPDKIKRF